MKNNRHAIEGADTCPSDSSEDLSMLAIYDAIELLGGKWKLPIMATLFSKGTLRFGELERQVRGITPKMLSKELYVLEINKLVSRTVQQTKPVSVSYELTPYAASLQPVLSELAKWGNQHRQNLMEKSAG